jgi:hypothetical protein
MSGAKAARGSPAALQSKRHQLEEDVAVLHQQLCTLLNCSSEGACSDAAAAWPALIGRLTAKLPGLEAVVTQKQLLIVSKAAKEQLQSAVNGHTDHSGLVLLKVVEELLQAT